MRSDAAANRHRVLIAAAQVFAEQGLDASTHEIARRAGVGNGTVFRHFPTKRDLIESTLLAHFEILAEQARAAELHLDAASALFQLTEQLADHAANKLTMSNYLFSPEGLKGPAKQASLELNTIVERVLRRAQKSGAVRDDIGMDEIYFLIRGLAQSRIIEPDQHSAHCRILRVVFDGLRGERGASPHRMPNPNSPTRS
jgi:AcrR family transcriptional regulator